jgi:predicted transposase/invertase (TIGR01784 family)
MQKRKLEELNLIDDFLLYHMVSHPEFGEEFTRDLLRIILGKEVGKLTIIPQKVYYGTDTDKHGARLDVYLEEDELENATIFDLEPESEEKDISLKSLPRRARFYHSKIDASSLQAGVDYHVLKNVIVIFIMPKDPFGENRMVYTFQKGCVELPELLYDDGAKTIFLYTKGTKGNIKEELKELLQYMEKSCEENAKNKNCSANVERPGY